MSVTVTTQTTDVTAVALPAGVAVRSMPPSLLTAQDFVLVSTREQYADAVALGAQPILVTLSFSVTDRRGRARLALGRLLAPWRWRRVLLNEGIAVLTVLPGRGRRDFTIAARLARTGLRRVTEGSRA
jgi:hypothetical protein